MEEIEEITEHETETEEGITVGEAETLETDDNIEYIFFNEAGEAFAQEFNGYFAKIPKSEWNIFCLLTFGKEYKFDENGNFVDLRQSAEYIAEKFEKAKNEKLEENIQKANNAIDYGYVVFKTAQFETNAKTLTDLKSVRDLCIALGEESYNWLSMDDKIVELVIDTENITQDDFVQLGLVVQTYKNNVWINKYLAYKEEIENARTIEELEAIEIDYDIDV